MDTAMRESFARDGFVVLPDCVPQTLLRGLEEILLRHVGAWQAGMQGEPTRSDDWHAGFTKDPITGQWRLDPAANAARSHHTEDDRVAGADGQRWAPEAGLPLDPQWGGPYRQILTIPRLHAVLTEILGDVRWGHASPAVPAQDRPKYRLDHDYVVSARGKSRAAVEEVTTHLTLLVRCCVIMRRTTNLPLTPRSTGNRVFRCPTRRVFMALLDPIT